MATKKQKIFDVNELLKGNPHADAEQVAKARAAIRALRDAGFEGATYNLVSPFAINRSTKRSTRSRKK